MKLVRPITIDDDVLVSSNVAETETEWSALTTYASGAAVYEVVDGVHQRFVSKQNSNLNHRPSEDATETWWEATGPTNRWAMFDGTYQTQTTKADEIAVELQMPAVERLDVVWLGNLEGTAAQVTITDALEGVVYDETHSLVSPSGITDWYSYFFEPIARLRDLTLEDLPPVAGAAVEVSITEAGATVACGALLVGFSKNLGDTRWDGAVRIRDFSVKEDDGFGGLVVVERAYRKLADLTAILPNSFVDELTAILTDYRARPALWIGFGAYEALTIWGFVKDWAVEMSLPPDRSLVSLQLEGLT